MKKTSIRKKAKKHTNAWYRAECVKIAKRLALERDGYTCQRCGLNKFIDNIAMHGSHVFPEGTYHGLSANIDNIKALCYRDHFLWWHKHPTEAGEWFASTFPERYAKLKVLSRKTIQIDWKSEFEKMKLL